LDGKFIRTPYSWSVAIAGGDRQYMEHGMDGDADDQGRAVQFGCQYVAREENSMRKL
jgi:hypothetical protein